ncbi:hypothetical protein C8J57DRAFT_1106517, partial [Mycena rebaudengoi]
ILVGFRTPSGRVTTTRFFKTIDNLRTVHGKPYMRDPASLHLRWETRFCASYKLFLVGTNMIIGEVCAVGWIGVARIQIGRCIRRCAG